MPTTAAWTASSIGSITATLARVSRVLVGSGIWPQTSQLSSEATVACGPPGFLPRAEGFMGPMMSGGCYGPIAGR